MYGSPKIRDLGRVEVHTYALSGSAPEVEEPTATGSGGGGSGFGLVGLIGTAAIMAGRGSDEQLAAGIVDDEEEKQAQK